MHAYKKAIETLKSKKIDITVIDIGCARGAFINEFLINYFKRENIRSIGIDPILHPYQFNAKRIS